MVTCMKKILIIDGSNLLFQMFFGMPSRIYNTKGIGIWGVLGFVGALLRIIRQINPDYLTVLFDGENENKRTLIEPTYKANRKDYSNICAEENPFSQLPYIYNALQYMGISYAETFNCEVDDWVSSYVKFYGKDNKIIISSFDSDYFQLISENVSVLRYKGKKTIICTPEYVSEKYGVEAWQYADFKSLVGDRADNIMGADKIGIKTASKLLRTWGTLDNIIKNAELIEKQAIRESIIKNCERLKQNIRLVKLDGHEKLPVKLNAMQYTYNGITTTEVLHDIGLKE